MFTSVSSRLMMTAMAASSLLKLLSPETPMISKSSWEDSPEIQKKSEWNKFSTKDQRNRKVLFEMTVKMTSFYAFIHHHMDSIFKPSPCRLKGSTFKGTKHSMKAIFLNALLRNKMVTGLKDQWKYSCLSSCMYWLTAYLFLLFVFYLNGRLKLNVGVGGGVDILLHPLAFLLKLFKCFFSVWIVQILKTINKQIGK